VKQWRKLNIRILRWCGVREEEWESLEIEFWTIRQTHNLH
jgi:hypothetical protein